MWKMQLLDENHILIRYASEDVATIKIQEPNTQASFFVVYNMVTTKVNLYLKKLWNWTNKSSFQSDMKYLT